jgi:inner membrane protein involved in colicin E2 resistance
MKLHYFICFCYEQQTKVSILQVAPSSKKVVVTFILVPSLDLKKEEEKKKRKEKKRRQYLIELGEIEI